MTELQKMIMRGIVALHMEIKTCFLSQFPPEQREDINKSLNKMFYEFIADNNNHELNQWLDEFVTNNTKSENKDVCQQEIDNV